jgi:hypothetical protein
VPGQGVCVTDTISAFGGFDHGVGLPFLLLGDAKAPNCRKNKVFKDVGHYSEWPKVADAVIKVDKPSFLALQEGMCDNTPQAMSLL